MMNEPNALNARQTDALTEVVNIAFGLTAAKLAEISGCRVLLDAPTVGIHPIHALARELGPFVTGPAASVHQVFSGPVSGDAILFLNYESVVTLSNLLAGDQHQAQSPDPSTYEILTEVGNMLLGTCLGAFGNLLDVRVSFSIPQLHLDSLEHFLTSLSIGGGQLQHAVVIAAPFHIPAQGAEGWLVIVLAVSSLEQWIQAIERWEFSQY
jgi:chemotaxis protein CheC